MIKNTHQEGSNLCDNIISEVFQINNQTNSNQKHIKIVFIVNFIQMFKKP